MFVIPINHEGLQMSEVLISFDEISESDVIRTVRTNGDVIVTVEGRTEYQDEDGDWLNGDELLTFRGAYDEEYYLLESGSLPDEPGTLVTYSNHLGLPVFALKLYGDEGWLATFPDGSAATFEDLYIARKDWELAN
jgi:hypothetical protein